MPEERSLLAQALYGLLMETDLWPRDRWARFFSKPNIGPDVPVEMQRKMNAMFDDWFADRDIPRPDQMELILRVLADHTDPNGTTRAALERFYAVMRMQSNKISPHCTRLQKLNARNPDINSITWVAAFMAPNHLEGMENILMMIDPSRLNEFFDLLVKLYQNNQDLTRPR